MDQQNVTESEIQGYFGWSPSSVFSDNDCISKMIINDMKETMEQYEKNPDIWRKSIAHSCPECAQKIRWSGCGMEKFFSGIRKHSLPPPSNLDHEDKGLY